MRMFAMVFLGISLDNILIHCGIKLIFNNCGICELIHCDLIIISIDTMS